MKFFLILILLITNVFGDEPNSVCPYGNVSKDECISKETNSPGFQCCLISNSDSSQCLSLENDGFIVYTNPKLKKIYNEEIKLIYLLEGDEPDDQFNIEIACKDETITNLKADYDPTDEDKTIFESGKHCLNYFFNPGEVTKEICQNAQVFKKTSEAGIKCGFYEIEITDEDGSKSNFKACYFVYNNLLKGEQDSKILFNSVAKGRIIFQSMTSSIDFSYTLNFSSSDGLYANYDSKTNKITVFKSPSLDGSKTNKDTDLSEKKASSSYNLYNSKLLLLLFLILL